MSDNVGQNWLNGHAERKYPLADSAKGTSRDGTRLPDDAIVDLQISWPEIAGKFAFLGGLTITGNLVTAVILAADSQDATTGFTPLAAVTLIKPVTRYKYYALDPLYPDTSGFIAFDDTVEPCVVQLPAAADGLLASRVCRPFKQLPIASMRKYGRVDGLTGIVKLLAGTDVEIVARDIEENRKAIVIRLAGVSALRNPLADYIGPCGGRPESQNCNREGVEHINGVSPDCDGNIEIVFKSMVVAPYTNCGSEAYAGITVEQAVGLTEVCAAKNRVHARFPGEDYCEESSEMSLAVDPFYVGEPLTMLEEPGSIEIVAGEPLPFNDNFNSLHPSWRSPLGVSETADGELVLPSASQRNIHIWDDNGYTDARGKEVVTCVRLPHHNGRGGLVLNYREHADRTHSYLTAQLNRGTNKLELIRFNGSSYIVEHAVSLPKPLRSDHQYILTATISHYHNGVTIAVSVKPATVPGPSTRFIVTTNRWVEDGGKHGVTSERSVAHFTHWGISDA